MQWLRSLTVLCAVVLAACGDAARGGGGDAAPAAASPGPRSDGAGAGANPTAMEITAVVGGRKLTTKGMGECQHAAEGSIYQRPASLWTARFDGAEADAVRHLNLAFWREQSGPESFNLSLGTGDEVHRIATVPGGELHGKGTATLEGGASAGTLTVDGATADGTPMRLQVRCDRFTTLVAEGG